MADQDATIEPTTDTDNAGATPVVTPTPGMDETVEGGAYRRANGDWVSAEGLPIKPPKGKANVGK